MTFAYICTNYNNSHYTRVAVESLCQGSIQPEHIVIVDNASDATNVAELKALVAEFPNVELILNPDNSGYFPGLNLGILRMREVRPEIEYLVIGNNDLTFPENFANVLAEVMPENSHNPVVSPNMITLDGMHQNPHVISGISRKRELVYDLYYANYYLAQIIGKLAKLTRSVTDRHDEDQHEIAQYIYQGHGSCYILTPRFFQLFEKLWAPTFLMGEEYFLSKQLSDKGFQTYYEPRIVIQHHCNGAIQNVPSRKMWHVARDAHRVYRRYVKPWQKQAANVAVGEN